MSIETIIAELKGERDRLNRAIAALERTDLPKAAARAVSAASSSAPAGKKRRGLTPEGRKRLSEMMKKRWAEKKKKASRGRKES